MFVVPSHGNDDATLVGREAETDRLTEVVRALRGGRGTVLEIAGEAGIGKTSMMTVLAGLAARDGAAVARAHALRGNSTAFQVFRDACGDLAALRSPGPGAEPEAAAEAAFRALRPQLAAWASAGAGVLLLDDVHWSDPQSAALVLRLVRSPVPGPLVLALAHRPRQIPSSLLEALNDGVRTGTVVRVEPAPLDTADVTALLTRWRASYHGSDGPSAARGPHPADPAGEPPTPGSTDAEYAERLRVASQGNPRNLRILVAGRWYADDRQERSAADTDGLLREAAPVTADLDALSPDAAAAAGAAAVLGDPFRPEDVAYVSGLEFPRALAALTELTRTDLVAAVGRAERYAFRHRALAHIVHERLDPDRRVAAHRRALDLHTGRDAPASVQARHAEHLVGADCGSAPQILAQGAAEIVATSPATAARWLRQALESFPDGRGGASHADVALACCRALAAAGRLDEARALVHEVLRDPAVLPVGLRLEAYAVCSAVERLLGRYEEAEAVAHAARQLLELPLSGPLPVAEAETILQYGLIHALRGTHGLARPLIHQAARVTGAGDPHPVRTAVRVLSLFYDAYLGETADAAAEVGDCACQVDGLPDAALAQTPEVLALLGCAELYLERFTDASRHLRRGLRALSGGAQRHVLVHQLLGLAVADQWAGRLDQSHRRALDAEALARTLGAADAEGLAITMRASTLSWQSGRKDSGDIVALAENSIGLISPGQGWWTSSAVGMLAQTRLLAGDPAAALSGLLDEGGGEELTLLQPALRPSALAVTAAAALRVGEVALARRVVTTAESAAARLRLPVQRAHVQRARAALHLADGDHDAAARDFDQAARAFRGAGMPVQYAWTLVTGAHAHRAVHGRAAGLRRLDEAQAAARRCGALRVCEEAVRVRSEIAASGSLDATVPTPLGLLSRREREIAELAASGMRSRHIAEQLFVSPRTVDAHLTRIYRKLDVSSRTALAGILRQTGPT